VCVFWRCEKRGSGHDFAWAELGEATCTKGKQRMANTSPQAMANLLDTACVWRQCFLGFEKRWGDREKCEKSNGRGAFGEGETSSSRRRGGVLLCFILVLSCLVVCALFKSVDER